MNLAEILCTAQAMGVRLRLDGDRVKIAGPIQAVASLKPEIAAHKPEIVSYLLAAANDPGESDSFPVSPDGGAFMPWCAPVTPSQVTTWQAELLELIEEVADSECWSPGALNDVLIRAIRGPLSDLRPNLGYFRQRVADIEAERRAKRLVASRTWSAGKDLDDRRG
jgi:TubC N-terminal docking domain